MPLLTTHLRRAAEVVRRVLAPRDAVSAVLMNRATTGLLLVGATTTAVGVVLRDDLPHRAAVALFAVGAVVAAVVLHALRRLVPVWAYHLTQLGSSAAIATGVHLYGGGEHAIADASLMVLPVASSAFYFSGPGVAVHAAVSALSLVAALAPLGTSPADLFTTTVVITVTAVLVRGLARAAESTGTDPLTRLADRTSTTTRLQRSMEQSRRTADPVTFVVLGLDAFTAVNDIRGHAAGDALLRSLATTWGAALPSGSLLGRWGGDEFALVLRSHADTAWELLDVLRARCPDDLSFSAGVVSVEVDDDVEAVVDHAEGSLAVAKRERRGSSHLWVPGTPTSRSFLAALEAGEVEVHYQPVVSLAAGRTTGAEALVRWRRPGGGFVPPSDFLPHAETSGAVVDLGRFVLRRACADAAAWPHPAGAEPLTVAVNASGTELAHQDYAAWVVSALHAADLPGHRLVVEVVEGLLDEDSPVVADNLHALRAAGVRLAVDDFGTGWSSLARLGRLPLDVLKVDRSFVSTVAPGSDAALCAGVVALAQALDMSVVAEGVETEHQAAWLRERGCQEAQGWLWAPALPTADFAERLLREVCAPAPRPAGPAPSR
ncbi:bifunctional diguanylate cyclase/phosphodiesterase [Quadrisphaera sp. INWT6]|uniref:putative bifunctional diguanylate cyclase/phosphodiesterase n=1 Tax=Quadrisphaera sp. INWT6 TaxID=2596917 RepID=UPI0018925599|nr:bifunctional diguanylate cyclase/phosphodiesterase [Quadrisphaera sp. INWT6]MBF5081901.1 bifunctional diguanylate cyclase/phosphodiesterase [Quadrisphaera sp. INWT6]